MDSIEEIIRDAETNPYKLDEITVEAPRNEVTEAQERNRHSLAVIADPVIPLEGDGFAENL